jgi:hypothetical protein
MACPVEAVQVSVKPCRLTRTATAGETLPPVTLLLLPSIVSAAKRQGGLNFPGNPIDHYQ